MDMADPVTWTAIAAVGTLAAAGVSAYGSLESGRRSREAAEMVATQEEAQGTAELAAAQREAEERKWQGRLVASRQQAIAAASGAGAGADAPTIVTIMQKTAERAAYGAETAIYGGQSRRDALNRSARNRRITGNADQVGSYFTAAGTLAGGLGRFGELQARA
jgi:hypothetical protein